MQRLQRSTLILQRWLEELGSSRPMTVTTTGKADAWIRHVSSLFLIFSFGKALGTDGVVAWIRDRAGHHFSRLHAELYCMHGLTRGTTTNCQFLISDPHRLKDYCSAQESHNAGLRIRLENAQTFRLSHNVARRSASGKPASKSN